MVAIEALQFLDGDQDDRRPAVHGDRDPLMLTAHAPDKLRQMRLGVGERPWSQV